MLHTHGTVDEEVVQRAVERSDRLPFFLHLIFKYLPVDGVAPEAVDAALDDAFADLDRTKNLTHLLSRIDIYYGDDAERAEAILDRVSSGPTSLTDLGEIAPAIDRPRAIVDLLCSDHYLVVEGSNLRWRYDSLRRLWRRRRHLDGDGG